MTGGRNRHALAVIFEWAGLASLREAAAATARRHGGSAARRIGGSRVRSASDAEAPVARLADEEEPMTIEAIVRSINRELTPRFEERLRAALAEQDREWLIDQIVRLTLDAHSLEEIDRRVVVQAKSRARAERLARVRAMTFDLAALQAFLEEFPGITREGLIDQGFLAADSPEKGTALLVRSHRTEAGDALLVRAKDTLFALLFGDASTNTHLERVQQELLTIAMPRSKAWALDFMRASTEMAAAGTWQDPSHVSNDERADNVMLEVQYGEVASELVGDGIVLALSLINNLEVNEQVLYARMINVEETTLIV
jgi:hypothetical protein